MKIIISGGAGFIGSHIADRCLADGHQVLIIDDLSSGFQRNVPKNAEFLQAPIASSEALTRVSHFEPDIFIHAAAQVSVRISMENPALDAEQNVLSVLKVLSSVARPLPEQKALSPSAKSPHFIFLSTGGAMYGEAQHIPTSESDPALPESLYGLHKRFGELYLDFWHRVHQMPYTALRLANVYGPRQNPHGEAGVVAIFAKRLLQGEPCTIYGDGKQTRDFVYVRDVARAVSAVIQRTQEGRAPVGVFNIGAGLELSVQQVYDEMHRLSASHSELEYGPLRMGEQRRSAIHPGRALEQLGWKAETNLSTGLQETLGWFREVGGV